jgi:hypothetical protein
MIQSKSKNHSHTSAENAFRTLSNEMTVNVKWNFEHIFYEYMLYLLFSSARGFPYQKIWIATFCPIIQIVTLFPFTLSVYLNFSRTYFFNEQIIIIILQLSSFNKILIYILSVHDKCYSRSTLFTFIYISTFWVYMINVIPEAHCLH